MVALDRLGTLERELATPIYPIIGVGSVPFRGGFRPGAVQRCLRTYPSVQTFTVQSAFKYDHPAASVAGAITEVRTAPRRAPPSVASDRCVRDLIDRVAARYEEEVAGIAPLVMAVSRHVPRRRRRRLHIGLFGYSRASGAVSLPRAIPFCASLYSIGLPPEVLGWAALSAADVALLDELVPTIREEMCEATRYLDPDALSLVPPEVRASALTAMDRFGVGSPDLEHRDLARRFRARSSHADGQELSELIVRGGSLRGFLG
jgi:phosphoenolpyruvate carboxylase